MHIRGEWAGSGHCWECKHFFSATLGQNNTDLNNITQGPSEFLNFYGNVNKQERPRAPGPYIPFPEDADLQKANFCKFRTIHSSMRMQTTYTKIFKRFLTCKTNCVKLKGCHSSILRTVR